MLRSEEPGEPNATQIEYWNAATHWVDDQSGHDEMLEPLGRLAIGALAPRRDERVLDVGCGTGTTTLELAEAVGPEGSVLGVDVSGPMLDVARTRAPANVAFVVRSVHVTVSVRSTCNPKTQRCLTESGLTPRQSRN